MTIPNDILHGKSTPQQQEGAQQRHHRAEFQKQLSLTSPVARCMSSTLCIPVSESITWGEHHQPHSTINSMQRGDVLKGCLIDIKHSPNLIFTEVAEHTPSSFQQKPSLGEDAFIETNE